MQIYKKKLFKYTLEYYDSDKWLKKDYMNNKHLMHKHLPKEQ